MKENQILLGVVCMVAVAIVLYVMKAAPNIGAALLVVILGSVVAYLLDKRYQ